MVRRRTFARRRASVELPDALLVTYHARRSLNRNGTDSNGVQAERLRPATSKLSSSIRVLAQALWEAVSHAHASPIGVLRRRSAWCRLGARLAVTAISGLLLHKPFFVTSDAAAKASRGIAARLPDSANAGVLRAGVFTVHSCKCAAHATAAVTYRDGMRQPHRR